MKYEPASDLQEQMREIVLTLNLAHINLEEVKCIRSFGSKSRAIARCHALGKVMQKALGRKGFYALEFCSEKFDAMSKEDKIKVIIHELMHIPFCFGGGFKHHDYVTQRNVNKVYDEYVRRRYDSENKN